MKLKINSGSRMAAAQMHALAAVRREIRTRDTRVRCKYLREFNSSFRQYERALSTQEMEGRITSASLLLVGDYHALAASQKFAAGLVERIVQKSKLVLGVEAILSRDQQHLDSWWRREISETQLRERIRFDREWGYDWEPFYELLVCAREQSDGIYGLDCMPRHDLRSIRSRDRHAAGKIREMRQQHPDAAILVLFGESHMAPQHLPSSLQKLLPEERALTVLQNIDSIYWDAVGKQAKAVSISDDVICVFTSSPLEKYESYRLCLDRWNAASDDPADFAPAVYNLIFSLARSLGFRLDSPHNGTQPKFLADSLPEVALLDEKAEPGSPLAEPRCMYSPETNTMFVRSFNMFSAAREAARFLHCACTGKIGQGGTPPEQSDVLAYFGARLLCPGAADDLVVNMPGEELYKGYIAGTISHAAIRRMFLGLTA
jgi:uncharacterized iron-regulated protein